LEIGEKVLQHLILKKQFKAAALHCNSILKDKPELQTAQLWESWIEIFAREKQIAVLSPYIPTKHPRLSEAVYEAVLNLHLNDDADGFMRCICTWPQVCSLS
jgi:hypothetical protein